MDIRNCKSTSAPETHEIKTAEDLIQFFLDASLRGGGMIMGRELRGQFDLDGRRIEYNLENCHFKFTPLSEGK